MMDPTKVAGVLEWPTPTTKKEVQLFLGFVMVVVDSVTKCGHFVDTVTTLSAAGTARLYIQHI